MKRILLAAIAIFSIASCNNCKQKCSQTESSVQTTATETKASSFYGTYKGSLPAADCEGIETTLTINSDSTYTLTSKYLGKDAETYETNGVYNLLNEKIIELVTPSSGDKTYYVILDDSRIMLSDEKGTINNGELAELYILKK